MTSKTPIAQTTIYQNRHRETAFRGTEGRWHPEIVRLVRAGYAFLPGTYARPGVLFRGISSDLTQQLGLGELSVSRGPHSLEALERETGVVFVSQDLSDAISVTQMWETAGDSGVLVIDASIFAQSYAEGYAATLAFADPGVVFRYPFFVSPLPLAAVKAVIVRDRVEVSPAIEECGAEVIVLADANGADLIDRRAVEEASLRECASRGYRPAEFSAGGEVPR